MFEDRIDAGERLAKKLREYHNDKNAVILGIPRGGVVVASIVSKNLNLPLDIIVIKKIGLPEQEEFAIGATGPKISHIDEEKVEEYNVSKKFISEELKLKQKEAKKRYDFLFEGRTPKSLKNKKVILIDDGIATGETMKLAVQIVKKNSPRKVIVAIPVASKQALERLDADKIVCITKPRDLSAVGEFYTDFLPVEDSEVKIILENA